ncbi:hypothetical protein M3Y98_00435700 [Aphelenchoides besseyi]|nr:hypothetical protein M3Y98_00435700 [Aphelenchoides besseyi]KAI6202536.1 hypothetical protein M3Y96_00959300 [Aphelenchoides besseyi]
MKQVLLFVVTICFIFTTTKAQRSFANTKFDLSSDLPTEDITIAENQDAQKKPESKPHPHKQHLNEPIEALPSTASQAPPPSNVVNSATATPINLLRTLAPIAVPSSNAPVTLSPFTIPTFSPIPGFPTVATPLPPQQPAFPRYGFPGPYAPQGGQVAGFVPQSIGQPIQPSFQPSIQTAQVHQPHPVQPQLPGPTNVQFVRFTASPDQPEVSLWFREDYDVSVCNLDPKALSGEFRQKFPRNLWRNGNGKETILAELLFARLATCFEKQQSHHWIRVNDLIATLQLPTTEEDECRTGLIQEQIACRNVFSYTCQFIQKEYIFRLVPTRIIIQEARIAEDGAEKCRKIVRKVKKELQG